MKAPQSLASERAVLGGLLLDCKLMPMVNKKLCVEDFMGSNNKKIYRTMDLLYSEHGVFDAHLVSERLPEIEVEIFQIANSTPSVANIGSYCDIVREKSVQRKLIDVANDIAHSAKKGLNKDVGRLIDEAEQKVNEAYEDGRDEDMCPAQERLVSFFMELTYELENAELTEEYLSHTIVEVNKALVDTLQHVEGYHDE